MSSYYNYGKFINDLNYKYSDCYEKNISDYFFIIIGILSSGFMFTFYLVSFFYNKDKDNDDFHDNEFYNYEKKYYDDFKILNDNKLTNEELDLLKKCILYENTPNGEVIMYYNNDTESFYYWCDNKNIKYMVLDSVVHKYAIEYNCKSICIDYKNEYDDGLNELRNIEKNLDDEKKYNDNDKCDNNDNSVFVKFKNYKTNQNIDKSNKKFLITKNSNRFTYKGTIEEYYKFKNNTLKNIKLKKNICYSDFKKIK